MNLYKDNILDDSNESFLKLSNINAWNLNSSSRDKQSELFLRNNRSNRRKNLRCFPSCSKAGHSSYGFCGDSYNLKLSCNEIDTIKANINNIYAYAFFTSHEFSPKLTIGAEINPEILDDISKSDTIYSGSVSCDKTTDVSSKNIEVNIKFSPPAWTYNYKSNRFAKGMHYLQIILTFNDQNKEKVLYHTESKSFKLYSSRRTPADTFSNISEVSVDVDEEIEISDFCFPIQSNKSTNEDDHSPFSGDYFLKSMISCIFDYDGLNLIKQIPCISLSYQLIADRKNSSNKHKSGLKFDPTTLPPRKRWAYSASECSR